MQNLAKQVMKTCSTPLLLVRPTDAWRSRRPSFARLLLPLNGSATAEKAIPFARALADHFHAEVLFLSVPEGSESE